MHKSCIYSLSFVVGPEYLCGSETKSDRSYVGTSTAVGMAATTDILSTEWDVNSSKEAAEPIAAQLHKASTVTMD